MIVFNFNVRLIYFSKPSLVLNTLMNLYKTLSIFNTKITTFNINYHIHQKWTGGLLKVLIYELFLISMEFSFNFFKSSFSLVYILFYI